ncbi:hypothetical protein [Arthrobacter sp. zg-Y1219]|uniref:hypothetical protein n=1 Tax=Arthrobacter sp. zg-Y1219 TaxID=3049067 RepID=UPI0024C27723|nr:hypothetical protein [Arthrobacter sp. zg-Y1219]
METEAEPGYLGMPKGWFYRALIGGMIFGAIFAGVTQQWWIMTITVLIAVAVGSAWSVLRRRRCDNVVKGD